MFQQQKCVFSCLDETIPLFSALQLYRTNTASDRPDSPTQPAPKLHCPPFTFNFPPIFPISPSFPVYTQALFSPPCKVIICLTVRFPVLHPEDFHDFIYPLVLISFNPLVVRSWGLASLVLQKRPGPVSAPVPRSELKHIRDKVVIIKTRKRPPWRTCTSPLFSPPLPFIKRLIFW